MDINRLLTYLIIMLPLTAAGSEIDHRAEFITAAADGAEVSILSPENNQVVSSPFIVVFGAENVTISPAGDNQPNSGHHHLLIDIADLPDLSKPLPATDQIIHFGKGQTETVLALAPGTHTLQLLLGNYLHIPHSKPVISEKITITVK